MRLSESSSTLATGARLPLPSELRSPPTHQASQPHPSAQTCPVMIPSRRRHRASGSWLGRVRGSPCWRRERQSSSGPVHPKRRAKPTPWGRELARAVATSRPARWSGRAKTFEASSTTETRTLATRRRRGFPQACLGPQPWRRGCSGRTKANQTAEYRLGFPRRPGQLGWWSAQPSDLRATRPSMLSTKSRGSPANVAGFHAIGNRVLRIGRPTDPTFEGVPWRSAAVSLPGCREWTGHGRGLPACMDRVPRPRRVVSRIAPGLPAPVCTQAVGEVVGDPQNESRHSLKCLVSS